MLQSHPAGRPRPRGIPGGIIGGLAVGCLLSSLGCGYAVGHPFQAEIRSIYVPVFESHVFRRGVEYPLTEAVQKQIQLRTPFRLVDESAADTQLIGRIVDVRKSVLGETRFDDPRELQVTYAVDVRWENLRTGETLAQQRVPITDSDVRFLTRAEFAPEVGQSLATATQQAVDRLARDIVNMLEAPW